MDELGEVRSITTLKARYCRYVDTKQWAAFRDLFTDDLHFENRHRGISSHTAEDFVDRVSSRHAESTSVHVASMPEIEVLDTEHARGIWAFSDLVIFPTPTGRITQRGSGHYTEEYRKDSGVWRISQLIHTRLWIEVSEEHLRT